MIKIKTNTLENGKTNRNKRVQRRHKKQIKTETHLLAYSGIP